MSDIMESSLANSEKEKSAVDTNKKNRRIPPGVRLLRTLAVLSVLLCILIVILMFRSLWHHPSARNDLARIPIFKVSFNIPESAEGRMSWEWISSKNNLRTPGSGNLQAGRYLRPDKAALIADSIAGGAELRNSSGKVVRSLGGKQVLFVSDWYLERRVWNRVNFPIGERDGLLEVDTNRGVLTLTDLASNSAVWKGNAEETVGTVLGRIEVLNDQNGPLAILLYVQDKGLGLVYDPKGELLFKMNMTWDSQFVSGQFDQDEEFEIAVIQPNGTFSIVDIDGSIVRDGDLTSAYPRPKVFYPVTYDDGSFGFRAESFGHLPFFYDIEGNIIDSKSDDKQTFQQGWNILRTGSPAWIDEDHLVYVAENRLSIVSKSGEVVDWIQSDGFLFHLMSVDPSKSEAIVMVTGPAGMVVQVARMTFR